MLQKTYNSIIKKNCEISILSFNHITFRLPTENIWGQVNIASGDRHNSSKTPLFVNTLLFPMKVNGEMTKEKRRKREVIFKGNNMS